MNTLILKDERGAVETVPSCEGIATTFNSIALLMIRPPLLVETVPSCEGIATDYNVVYILNLFS